MYIGGVQKAVEDDSSRLALEKGSAEVARTKPPEGALQRDYFAVTNQNPKPFIWTKTADEILADVARFGM